MDAFLNSFHDLSNTLIPILGVIILVIVIILLINIIGLVRSAKKVTDRLPETVGLTNKSIEKVQAPLDTMVKMSATVDKVHDEAIDAAKATKDFIVTNIDVIKEKITSRTDKTDEIELQEPVKEDKIGE
ncbi:MAG: hypothetical protein KBT35_01825 [Firmicutes bacterium]|nr:hypothetical protein [Candidatus Colivicinus equi]